MKFRIRMLFISTVFVLLPAYANAENESENSDAKDVISRCLQGVQSGQDISALAESLAEMRGLELSIDDRFDGMNCLKTHFGQAFYFDLENSAFISENAEKERLRPEVAARLEAERKQAEYEARLEKVEAERVQALATTKSEYHIRLIKACFDKLEVDRECPTFCV
jgi:hypothetical protein